MLDWLKPILGDSYTEDIDQKISEQIGKSFVSRADFNQLKEDNKGLTSQTTERDKQLDELKKVDAAELQAEITRLQEENANAATKHSEEMEGLKMTHSLESICLEAEAHNVATVMPLFDMDAIKASKDPKAEAKRQIDEVIKPQNNYLFKADGTTPKFVGSTPGAEPQKYTKEEFNKLTYLQKLKFKTEQPEAYHVLMQATE